MTTETHILLYNHLLHKLTVEHVNTVFVFMEMQCKHIFMTFMNGFHHYWKCQQFPCTNQYLANCD